MCLRGYRARVTLLPRCNVALPFAVEGYISRSVYVLVFLLIRDTQGQSGAMAYEKFRELQYEYKAVSVVCDCDETYNTTAPAAYQVQDMMITRRGGEFISGKGAETN